MQYQERGRQNWRNFGTRGQPSNRRTGFRSRSQMRRDNQSANKQAEDFVATVSSKIETPDPSKMQKKNPTKENPKPEQPAIKLDHYTSDWIETDRKNIQVELRDDFEDMAVVEHTKSIAYDTDALQYEDPGYVTNMLLAFYGYTYCNVAYRLLITVPASGRSAVSDFIRELLDGEQPMNTPAFCEMLAHIGKSDIPSYGRLRIDSPLLSARKRIARAIYLLRDQNPFKDEFQFQRDHSAEELEHYKLLIWNDRDSMDWVREQAKNYIVDQLKVLRDLSDLDDTVRKDFPEDDKALQMCYPYIDVSTRNKDGTRRFITPDEVIGYWKKIRVFKSADTRRFMACLIMLAVSDDYFMKGNKRLVSDNDRWRNNPDNTAFPFLDSTSNQITDYMMLYRMNDVMNDIQLRYNYHVVVNNFVSSFRSRIMRIFDFVHISKEEFGDESQAILSTETNIVSNPLLNSQFQFRDLQKIAAGGIFRYAYRVRHHLAEEMLMKRTRQSMIAEIVSKFAKKKP